MRWRDKPARDIITNYFMITYVIQRGNAGFFWSRFHAAFYDTLIINASKNKAWLRLAEWLFNRWTGQ